MYNDCPFCLAYSFCVPINIWDTADLNYAILTGNDLYTRFIDNHGSRPYFLTHDELADVPDIAIERRQIRAAVNVRDIEHGFPYGIVGNYDPVYQAGALHFEMAIARAFTRSQYTLVTVGGITLAVIFNDANYYIFDSHARNYRTGKQDSNGASILLQFDTMRDLVTYFNDNYNAMHFNISPINFGLVDPEEHFADMADDTYTSTEKIDNDDMDVQLKNDENILGDMSPKRFDFEETAHSTCKTADNPLYTHELKNENQMHLQISRNHQMNYTDKGNQTKSSNNPLSTHLSEKDIFHNELTIIQTEHKTENQKKVTEQFKTQKNNNASTIIQNYPCTSQACNFDRFTLIDDQLSKCLLANHIYHFRPIQSFEVAHNYSYNYNLNKMRNVLAANHSYIKSIPAGLNITSIPENHSIEFEIAIRETMHMCCSSYKRLMYEDKLDYCKNYGAPGAYYCNYCKTRLQCDKLPPISNDNKMDAGFIPDVISKLNTIEKRFLAQIHIFMTVFLLSGYSQLGNRGMAVNFPASPQDLISNFNKAPIITVSFESTQQKNTDGAIHSVRSKCVLDALKWLKKNNPLFKDLNLNQKDFNTSEIDSDKNDTCCIDFEETMAISDNLPIPLARDVVSNIHHLRIPLSKEKPIDIYSVPNGEEKAFPWLFCEGKNGFKQDRITDKTFNEMYFKARFMHQSGRWRRDMSYLFQAANNYERRMLLNSVSIQMMIMKQTKGLFSENTHEPLTARNISDYNNNHEVQENSYAFMKNVRGSAAYFKNSLQNLLAMIKNIGPPHIFLTLSCDEFSWKEVACIIDQVPYNNNVQMDNMKEKCMKDPLFVVLHAEKRLEALFKYVINGPKLPLGSKVKDKVI